MTGRNMAKAAAVLLHMVEYREIGIFYGYSRGKGAIGGTILGETPTLFYNTRISPAP